MTDVLFEDYLRLQAAPRQDATLPLASKRPARPVVRRTLLDHYDMLCAAACDARLSRGDLAVLSVIQKHADKDGRAFPGPTRIGAQGNLNLRSVKRSLKKLEKLSYLRIERPGRRVCNTYALQFGTEPPEAPRRNSTEIGTV